jgi:hypothetical protein
MLVAASWIVHQDVQPPGIAAYASVQRLDVAIIPVV